MLNAAIPMCRPSPVPVMVEPQDAQPKDLLLSTELSEKQAARLESYINDDSESPPDWEEGDIVKVCWYLLKHIEKLQDPETPIIEKIWTLNWIFTDPAKRDTAFSFDFCVKVMSLSPLSHLPYIGDFDVDDFRDAIRCRMKHWMRESLGRFPGWVQDLVRANPQCVVERLDGDPQYLNKQIRAHESSRTAHLF